MYSVTGSLLDIDLSSSKIKSEVVDPRLYRKYLGGYGLGAENTGLRLLPLESHHHVDLRLPLVDVFNGVFHVGMITDEVPLLKLGGILPRLDPDGSLQNREELLRPRRVGT